MLDCCLWMLTSPAELLGLLPSAVMDSSITWSLILLSHHLAGLQQPALQAHQDAELSSGESEKM